MLREKRIVKKILAMLLIVSILLPYTTEVFAVALKQTDTEVKLETTTNHEGGDEESGFVTEHIANYDKHPYTYKVANSGDTGKTTVFKIRKEGDNAFEDALYCLNAQKAFPSEAAQTYTNVGDLKASNSTASTSVKNSIGASNYNALVWLFDNMYLRKQNPEGKQAYIEAAFADKIAENVVPPVTAEYIASVLTDDDIEVVQQWAMWYFTNGNPDGGYSASYSAYVHAKYAVLGTIYVSGMSTSGAEKTFSQISTSTGAARQQLAVDLFDYLVTSAKAATPAPTVTYPSFAMQDSDLNCVVDGDYYKVGPFKITSGTGTAEIKVVDASGNEIERSKYEILKEGETTFTTENVDQIFDTNYYICVKIEGNTITKVRVTLAYTTYETQASLWEPVDNTMQPVVLITRGNTPFSAERGKNIDTKIFDLALRKYIVKTGSQELTARKPTVDPSTIATDGTATYKHVKTPMTLEPGTNVVFELRVYNEGTLDGRATEITDYLPEGLTLTPYTVGDGSINDTYKWSASNDGRVATTTYLADKGDLRAYTGTGDLDSKYVQIECTIASDIADTLTATKTLTNVAEITGYSRTDNDSSKTIEQSQITDDWHGNDSNKADLTDPDYHYKGKEDDDDFEKIQINPLDTIDLALRKFVYKIVDTNNQTTQPTRTPVVDPTTIATTGTAKYKHAKQPLEVTPGTKILYEIRVYNEGSVKASATEITDYLPEGLIPVKGTVNDKYGWRMYDENDTETDDPTLAKYLKTTKLADKELNPYVGTGDLDSDYVRVECIVKNDIADGLTADKVLTNVAEITGYSRTDRDSSKTIIRTAITDSFSGDRDNKKDLSDSNYYYKGLEDDDDFEKVVIKVDLKTFDLALKKFITKINGVAPKTSREPVEDVSKLKDGSSTNATYTMPKSLLEVKKGDIVTYTIRVYNEGEIAGYAEEVSDFLPEGLGYLMNYKGNVSNKWAIPASGTTTKKLSEIDNGTANLKAEDFEGTTALADQIVVVGGGKFTSTKLGSSDTSTENLIPAFNGTKLAHKDIEITCIVLTDDSSNNSLKNIAEIASNTDENRVTVTDRDSIPNTVDPKTYPDGEKDTNNGNPQDDHDYENLITPSSKVFDLALQKFITKLNNTDITNRVPTVTKEANGKVRYSHSSEALPVANKDEVTYTIRVYNEGQIDGYAKEVNDDIPTGLEFLPDNATNKEYEWKMYDKDGKETSDPKQAVEVRTKYLCKDRETEKRQNLIKAYDPETMKEPDHKDVKLVFKVTESALKDKKARDIINTAEITANQDKDGRDIIDIDSTPGNKKDGEDDIDREKINLKYFDLALKKYIRKIVITENGKTREINPANGKELVKVEINRKHLSNTTVKYVYDIVVTNEGQIAGYAKEVKDYIPNGLVFNQSDNPNWTPVSADVIKTEALANTLLEPGKSATVQVVLEWNKDPNNLGEKINVAEISKDYNEPGSPDIDSTPDNKKEGEDDIDNAPVILSISTGEEPVYVVLSTTVLLILGVGIALIKKYVLI